MNKDMLIKLISMIEENVRKECNEEINYLRDKVSIYSKMSFSRQDGILYDCKEENCKAIMGDKYGYMPLYINCDNIFGCNRCRKSFCNKHMKEHELICKFNQ